MMLYLSKAPEGKVFHLRQDCPKAKGLVALSVKAVRYFRSCGLKRICLKCRKAAGKAG